MTEQRDGLLDVLDVRFDRGVDERVLGLEVVVDVPRGTSAAFMRRWRRDW